MKPLNYAILEYFTKVEKGSADDVIEALREDYGHHRNLRKKKTIETLMTAEKNGLLKEAGVALDENDNLQVHYQATDESKETIKKYIGH